jgi:hypothetical protein
MKSPYKNTVILIAVLTAIATFLIALHFLNK